MTDITVVAQKRILKDVRDVLKNPLTDEGITYIHDEDNMLKGYAMIIGPPNSPYEHGFFFFEIYFPTDYPYRPPVVKFCSGDGIVRFHPNLYRNGKVCLSILNTWDGEQWSSCLTLRSILITLRSLFDWDALTMEPGISKTTMKTKVLQYDQIVQIKTFELTILKILNGELMNSHDKWYSFLPIIRNYVESHKHELVDYYMDFKKKFCDMYDIKNNEQTIRFVIPHYQAKTVFTFSKMDTLIQKYIKN